MNRFVVFLFGMFFSIALIVGGMYFYLQKTNQDINVDIFKKEVKEDGKEKKLNTDSKLVEEITELYDLNSVSCKEIDRYNYFIENKKVNDLSNANKMFLAYRNLPVSKVENTTCDNYSSVWETNTNNSRGCGSNYTGKGNDHYANTSVVKEKDLKKSYENIFGKNRYRQIDFFAINYNLSYDNTNGNIGFSYDYINKAYVLTSSSEVVTCKKPNTEITAASTKGNEVYITRLITSPKDAETQYELVLKYTFENDNNKYLIKSIEKVGE